MAEKREESKSARKEDAKSAAAAPAKAGKKRLLMMAIAVAALLGGGAWWYLQGSTGDAGNAEEKTKVAPALPPVYVALEPFTVNLQPEEVGSQYMQIGITLKIAGQVLADKLKEQMPEVRNRLLLTLSSKKASEIMAPEGKTRLAKDLQLDVTRILDPEAAKVAEAAPVNVAADATEQTPGSAPPADGSNAEAATGQAPDAAEATPAETPAENVNTGPVLSVLFTSLIIQ